METDGDDEEPALLDRASRATRGKRMIKLVDEEIEVDNDFWNQDALKEEENDDNYEEEAEVADAFDSDFDDYETEPDDEVEPIADDRLPVKKRLIFPGKTLAKKKSKKTVPPKHGESKVEKTSEIENKTGTEYQEDVHDDLEEERTIRKSTRTAVVVRQAEREAIRAALQASTKPIKKKKEGEEKRMTQEEMLLEAAETEIMNLRNLERVLAREEEVKKRAVVQKAVYNGPQIRFSSRDGKNTLEFNKGSSFHAELCTTSIPYPPKAICAVTGLPAKYRDPKTGLPYATKEAFKLIREHSLKEESQRKRPATMEMGPLRDAVSGGGFLSRRRRSSDGRTGLSSDTRLGARFRSIPDLEIVDLD